MRIAVLGLGEAGSLYAEALAASGSHVAGFDPAATPAPAGVRRAASVVDAVAGAELVVALTGAAKAVAAAEEAAPVLATHACYADFSSAAPETKREIARAASVAVADVAVLAPVPRQGAATPLLVSGSGACRVAEVFLALGAEAEVLEAPVGAAAERKLLRSVFMKGPACPHRATARVRMTNTGGLATTTFPPPPGGRVDPRGTTAISGVPGTAAAVQRRWIGLHQDVHPRPAAHLDRGAGRGQRGDRAVDARRGGP